MTRLLTAMTAACALAAAAPAAAQYQYSNYAYANPNPGQDHRIAMLQTRLQAGVQQGTISRSEAQRLRPMLRQLTRLERRYSRNGLTQWEQDDLQLRIRNLRQHIRVADRGSYDRFERVDRYGNYIDGGHYGQGAYGQGGPYEPVRNQSVIGGLISSIFGGGGLRVGQRATGNLYGVPYEYRNTYRDGYGTYYRSDGRMIYQIDARNNVVTGVYPMNR